MTRTDTVLLLGNYRPTLTLARVLSRRGMRIIAGLAGCDGGAEHCRHVSRIWDHPSLQDDPMAFAAALARFVRDKQVTTVFPVSEDFVRFFTEHPDMRPAGATIAMVAPELAAKCLDKMHMMQLADTLQVPTAPFAMADSHGQLLEAADQTGFPLVVRPQDSTRRLNGKKALFAEDVADLQRQIPSWSAHQGGLILQRRATGKRHNIYFAAQRGQLFRYLHALILRTDNPDGSGLAVEGVTISPIPELRNYTQALAGALGYNGIGCAQFLVDDATGAVSFLEINARIAGNHALPEFAGLDLSTVLIDLAAGRRIDTTPFTGRSNIRYVWTYGDIDAAKTAWLKAEAGHGAAMVWGLRALWAALRADLHMTFAWSDPKPGLMAMMRLAPSWRRLIPHIRSRLSRRHPSLPKAKPLSRKLKASS